MSKLLLFDIDGTLLRGYGAGGRALRRAAEAVLGERCRDARIEFGGALDSLIFLELARHGDYAVDDATHAAFRRIYAEFLAVELATTEPRPTALPGVLTLLERLRTERPATLGLLTGNYRETGMLKLQAVGIDPGWFEVSAWGDMAPQRPGLVPVALSQLSRELGGGDVIVVGDTVRDVHCARENGCVCVAVATGTTPPEDLAGAGADLVLDNLMDPEPLLQLLD